MSRDFEAFFSCMDKVSIPWALTFFKGFENIGKGIWADLFEQCYNPGFRMKRLGFESRTFTEENHWELPWRSCG